MTLNGEVAPKVSPAFKFNFGALAKEQHPNQTINGQGWDLASTGSSQSHCSAGDVMFSKSRLGDREGTHNSLQLGEKLLVKLWIRVKSGTSAHIYCSLDIASAHLFWF